MNKTLIILTLTLIGLAACVPNRLQKSLVTKEAESSSGVPLAAPTPSGRTLQPQLGNANVDLNEVVALLPPDAIPAVLPEDGTDLPGDWGQHQRRESGLPHPLPERARDCE